MYITWLSGDPNVYHMTPLQVSSLFADVHELGSYIFDVMKDHLLVFDLKTPQGVRRIESHLMWGSPDLMWPSHDCHVTIAGPWGRCSRSRPSQRSWTRNTRVWGRHWRHPSCPPWQRPSPSSMAKLSLSEMWAMYICMYCGVSLVIILRQLCAQ